MPGGSLEDVGVDGGGTKLSSAEVLESISNFALQLHQEKERDRTGLLTESNEDARRRGYP